MITREFEHIIAKSYHQPMVHSDIITPTKLLSEAIGIGSHKIKGWHFGSGDPELWKYSSRLLIPGGRLLVPIPHPTHIPHRRWDIDSYIKVL